MQNKWIYPLGLIVIGIAAFYFYQKYKVAPDIDLQSLKVVDLSSQTVELSSLQGKKTLLCFAASWCGPCRQELKLINSVKETLLSEVTVLVISDEPMERVIDFKDMTGYPFTWLKMVNPFSSVGINSIPTSYLVNTKGKVTKKTVGYVDWKDPSTARHLVKLME